MSRPSVHLVVALLPEARPFVDHWGLEAVETIPFRLFERSDRRLVVSGVGKENAVEATRWLAARCPDPRTVWLDVGLCGHPTLEVGAIRTAHRIVDETSGEAWYPPMLVRSPWRESIELRTVARPELEYREEVGYEMEAAGFLAAARAVATAELVQVVKVVSDNRQSPPRRWSPKEASDLLRPHVPAIDRYLEALRDLAGELPRVAADEAFLEAFTARAHFTVSRRRQLLDLLRRVRALGIVVDPADFGGDAEAMLEGLRSRVESVPLRFE